MPDEQQARTAPWFWSAAPLKTEPQARLWLGRGERAEVRDLLGPIYGWFTEGFDTPDLREAKALIDKLG